MRTDFETLVTAALRNDDDANLTLHCFLFRYALPELSPEEHAYLHKQLEESPVENAAVLTLKGTLRLLEKNDELAIFYYEKAIVLNCALAMNNRAFMYHTGAGEHDNTPKIDKACELYDRAIELGNPFAMYNRACLFEAGHGTPDNRPDPIQAKRLYLRATDFNLTFAMYNLARLFEQGLGEAEGKPNYAEAIKWYDKAIETDQRPEALYCRARLHEKGVGEPGDTPNYIDAIKLHDKAIAQRIPQAMHSRARLHEKGLGEPAGVANYAQALSLYKQTITISNDAVAAYRAANLFEKGLGTGDGKPDFYRAKKYYKMAIQYGDVSQKTKLSLARCTQAMLMPDPKKSVITRETSAHDFGLFAVPMPPLSHGGDGNPSSAPHTITTFKT